MYLKVVVWNSRGQHENLLIYSFKIKFPSDLCQRFFPDRCVSASLCAERLHSPCFVAQRYILMILQQVSEVLIGSALLETGRCNF